MRFQVERTHLLDACNLAAAPVKRSHVPVLECLRIVATDGIRVFGTDMQMQAEAACNAAVSTTGSAIVHHGDLIRWLQSSPKGGLVDGVLGDGALTLTCGPATLKLPSMHDEDFPNLIAEVGVEVTGGVDAIRACAAFAEKDGGGRPYLQGVNFSGSHACASDGYSLARVPCPSDVAATVPGFGCAAIAKIAKAGGRLFIAKNFWRCEVEGGVIAGRVIAQEFPDVSRIIGAPTPIGQVDADALLDAVAMVSLGRALRVFMQIEAGALTVSGEGFDGRTPESAATVTCDFDKSLAVLFGRQIIENALSPFRGQVVTVSESGDGFCFSAGDGLVVMALPQRDHRTAKAA